MKYATILATLESAGLPALAREQLALLVGSDAGKAFADDLRWYAAGDRARLAGLAAVAGALDPGMLQQLARVGIDCDLTTLIRLARQEGATLFAQIRASAVASTRAAALAYLAGLRLAPAAAAVAAVPDAPRANYYSFKIFASSAALCISEACTRREDLHTVQIEGACMLGAPGARMADWNSKIVVQLTPAECYQMLAVLENRLASVKFDGHGQAHDKSLSIARQENHYFVRLMQRGRPLVAVPVRPVDALPAISLLYRQIMRNDPHLAASDVRHLVERMAAMTGSG